eukprot:372793_1
MRKARKLDKNLIQLVQENQSNQNPYGHVHLMEETCFCCIWNCSDFAISKWTYCWTIIMFFVIMSLRYLVLRRKQQQSVEIYARGGGISWMGSLNTVPNEIYEDCNGTDYEYNLECFKATDGVELNCLLEWSWTPGYDRLECNGIPTWDDECRFIIESERCSNFTISCLNDNFTFYDGNPSMFGCLSYCDYEDQ